MRHLVLIFCLFLTACISPTKLINPEPSDPAATLYDRVVIEIYSTDVTPPEDKTFEIFKQKLEEFRICKVDRIFIIPQKPVKHDSVFWNGNSLRALERKHRTIFDPDPDDRFLNVYIAIVPGNHAAPGKQNVIGLQYDDTSIAVFYRKAFNHSYRAALLLHELGHVIGLVDRDFRDDKFGPPVNPQRPQHCNVEKCVMFWRVNPKGVFDCRCKKDLLRLIAERTN